MRILVCNWRDLQHPAAGGAEVYTHEIMSRWAATGHDVTLFAATVAGAPDRCERDGVKIHRGGDGRLGVYRAARRWYEREGAGRFDLIIDEVNTRPFFCHQWPGEVPTVALAHQVAREVWFQELAWPVAAVGRWWLEPRWLAQYRYVPTLTISESSARSLRTYGLQRVAVAPVGVDPPPDIGETHKERHPTVIFVGRLAANKRPDDALEAFAHVVERFPDAKMWVVGSGAMALDLRRTAPRGVEFCGRVSNRRKYELMARAHVLVVTSVREGWAMVVDEAASVGTPTIGYDVDGLRDSVPGAGGVLVEPSPAALADALNASFGAVTGGSGHAVSSHEARDWAEVGDKVLSLAVEMCGLEQHSRVDPDRTLSLAGEMA